MQVKTSTKVTALILAAALSAAATAGAANVALGDIERSISNLALGATIVESSSSLTSVSGAEHAFGGAARDIGTIPPDGILPNGSPLGPVTAWFGANGEGSSSYFVADLGASERIERIGLRPTSNSHLEDRGTLAFQIRASNELAEVTGLTSTAQVILSGRLPQVSGGATAFATHALEMFNEENGLTLGSYQYLRFESLSAVNNNAGLGELMVTGDPRNNLALGAQVVDGSLTADLFGAGSLPFNEGGYTANGVFDGQVFELEAGKAEGNEHSYWLGDFGVENAFFVADLESNGRIPVIEQIRLWNTRNTIFNDRGTRDFTIEGSLNNIDFFPIVSGTLTDARNLDPNAPLPMDTFSVNPTAVRYLRFNAENFYGFGAGLNELSIEGGRIPAPPTIPEPVTGVLLGLGTAVLCLRRRRSGC